MMETNIPGSEDTLQQASRLLKTLPVKQLNTPRQCDIRFSTFVYVYNAMTHLDSRIANLQLLLKDYTTIIIWDGESRRGK